MLDWLKQNRWLRWIAPPEFEDERQTRDAALLHFLLLYTFISTVPLFILRVLITERWFPAVITAGIGLLTAVAMWIALRRGKVRFASLVYCLSLWGRTAFAGFAVGGVESPGNINYMIVVLLGAFLLGTRSTIALTVLCAGTYIVNLWTQQLGLAPVTPISYTPEDYVSTSMPVFLLLVFLLLVLVRNQNVIYRKKRDANDALRQSEQRFAALFQHVPVGISLSTVREGNIIDVNDTLLQMTGYQHDEVVGKNRADVAIWSKVGASINMTREEFVEILRTQRIVKSNNVPWITKTGDTIDVLGTSQIIEIDGVDYILTSGLDISEYKRAQVQLREAERLREEIEHERRLIKLKEEFVAMASHEFRTPLSVILSSKDMLERYGSRLDETQRRQYFTQISEQIEQMTRMLDDLLTLNQTRAGLYRFIPSRIDLVNLCEQLIDKARLIDEEQHVFRLENRSVTERLMLDELLVRHIVMNLLTNAAKYSPAGASIVLILMIDGETLELQVRDHGMGIPTSDQGHLFEPFYRASNVGQVKGTGLGLTLVKQSVEAHGGTIEYETVEGQGTTFHVRLPAPAAVPLTP
jgi:PAS domain S-box-containing protein